MGTGVARYELTESNATDGLALAGFAISTEVPSNMDIVPSVNLGTCHTRYIFNPSIGSVGAGKLFTTKGSIVRAAKQKTWKCITCCMTTCGMSPMRT